MRLLEINSVCGIRSTGRIATDIAQEYEKKGYEVKIAYGRETVPEEYQRFAVRIGNEFLVRKNGLCSRLLDNEGLAAKAETKRFLKWAEEFNPDELWLHNIHGYYINYELLFKWIKSRPQMKVYWTLHDCWAFTGHCCYFSYKGCEKWQGGCSSCPLLKTYPASYLLDQSHNNYRRKKDAFAGVKNLTVITPSHWLAGLVKQSFLKDYPIEVRHNTIDTEVFRPTPGNFREKHGLSGKVILLGIASVWEERKGLDDFIRLSGMLGEQYKIVLVGLSEKQMKEIPASILGITKTNSKRELAEIYSAADFFLNLTYEDNYPTVNLEAQACGTPCITYRTGGSVECVPPENVVEQGDLIAIVDLIKRKV